MRKITKIIIHCSATPEGRAVTVDEIRLWHKQRGFSDVGYHYIIGIDGSIHKGRAEEIVGAHCEGYNENSIGICYVGGLDKNMKPKDTRTPIQKFALSQLVIALKKKYPQVTVHGHNEFAKKECPCFDVKSEFK